MLTLTPVKFPAARDCALRLGVVFLAMGSFALAQNAPLADDEPVQLSAFEVKSRQDYGYRATNSVTATGIGTRIYETPIAVNVVTKDFISDLGSITLREALQFTPGITTDSRDVHNNVSRGFIAPTQVNRIGTFVRSPSSEFIERVEVVKGPNSVFFGRVAPGGVINVITLRPMDHTSTRVRATYGGYNSATAMLDHNQKLTDHASVRIAGAWHDRSDGFIDWTYDQYVSSYAALTWRLTPKFTLNVQADYKDFAENVSHSSPRSNAAYIARGTSAQTAAQFVAANFPPGTPTYDVYAYDLASHRGRRLNNNGPDAKRSDFRGNVMADLVGTLAPWWTVRFAGAYSGGKESLMEITGFPDVGGRYTNTRGVYNGSKPRSHVFEAESVLTFDLGPTKHRLIAGGRFGESRNTSFSISSNVTNHNHFTDGPRRLASSFSTFVPASYTRSRGKETALYAIDQIGFFADRLKLLGGVRRTEVEQVAVSANQSTLVAKETTPQVGAYFEVVKGVAVFANYSRTFEPQFSVDVFGQIAPNVEGEGKEAGLKVELGDGKLSGTLSAFQIERAGEVRRDFLREIAEGRTPIFIPGGTSMSEGTELELTFTPTRNYQAVLGYAFIWDAKVIQDTTTPQFVGQRLPLVPRHQASFWNRYTFVEGALKGLFVGAGVRYATRMNTINNVQFYLFQSGYTVVDALIGYQMKLGNRPTKLQVNVKNLFDREYGDGRWNMPADPVAVYFTAEFTF